MKGKGMSEFHAHDDMDILLNQKVYHIPLSMVVGKEVYILQDDRIVFLGSRVNGIKFIKRNQGKVMTMLPYITFIKEAGMSEDYKCPECNGSGTYRFLAGEYWDGGPLKWQDRPCRKCNGKGKIDKLQLSIYKKEAGERNE